MRFGPSRGLLHSRSAFGIALPLTASDRRHLGCGCSSVVEHDLAKVGVEGSSPFARSRFSWYLNYFRQAAERRLFRFDPGGATNGLGTAPSRHRFVRSDVTSALRFQWKPQVSSKRYDRVFRQTGSRSSALSQPQVQCATPGSAVYPTAHNSNVIEVALLRTCCPSWSLELTPLARHLGLVGASGIHTFYIKRARFPSNAVWSQLALWFSARGRRMRQVQFINVLASAPRRR